jgi:hypothetical protein
MEITISLEAILKQKGYVKIPFALSKTNHLLIKASINKKNGVFILDTGASNSCIDFSDIDFFDLKAVDSNHLATGAGSNEMPTKLSHENEIKIGKWSIHDHTIIAMDLSHVNYALKQFKAKPVKGILGADILMAGEALIDYANSFLYLKQGLT